MLSKAKLRTALILYIVIATPVLVGLTLIGMREQEAVNASEAKPLPTFILPTLSAETPLPTRTPVVITPTPTQPVTTVYTVQPGDTLYSISQKLGVDWQILALVNGMDSPDRPLSPGEVINVPDTTKVPTATITTGKQIMGVIGQQKVYAFQDGVLVGTFMVSTGTPIHPTVLGEFKIEIKLPSTTMTDHKTYYLENVPWTMYFGNDKVSVHEGYGLHGTYWHHNFGHPMSHGCVNLSEPDADWLYHWAPYGTTVTIVN